MKLKKQGRRVKSNVYGAVSPSDLFEACATPEAVVFLKNDHGVNRLCFYTASSEGLMQIVKLVPKSITIDILTKDSEEFKTEMLASGCHLLARMRRLSNPNVNETFDELKPPKSLWGG